MNSLGYFRRILPKPSLQKYSMAPTAKKRKVSVKKSTSDAEETTSLPKRERQYWLMKSEPESRFENGIDVKFGIDDLQNEPKQTACWDGVRNYQARNIMRDKMKVDDVAFFYHSNCKTPGIAGLVQIVKDGYPDDTQFDKQSIHYDNKSKMDNPRWFMVDVKFLRCMKRYITLKELKTIHQKHKQDAGPLRSLSLFTQSRLSVQPISQLEYEYILTLEHSQQNAD